MSDDLSCQHFDPHTQCLQNRCQCNNWAGYRLNGSTEKCEHRSLWLGQSCGSNQTLTCGRGAVCGTNSTCVCGFGRTALSNGIDCGPFQCDQNEQCSTKFGSNVRCYSEWRMCDCVAHYGVHQSDQTCVSILYSSATLLSWSRSCVILLMFISLIFSYIK